MMNNQPKHSSSMQIDIVQFKLVFALFLLALGVFLNTQLTAQTVWSYGEVLSMAEAQSIFRHQAVADNKLAKGRFKLYQTNLKPGVNLDILAPNYSKTSREIVQPDGSIIFQSVTQNNSSINLGIEQRIRSTGATVFLQSQLQRFDDFSLDFSQYNGIPFRAGIIQPLFAFNDLKWADQIEPLILNEADRQFIIDMENIHMQATVSFFDVLSAQLDEKIATSNTEVNEKLLEIANERFNLGKASKNDLLQLELEHKAAIKNLSKAKYQVAFTKGALQTFLGVQDINELNLLTPEELEMEVNIDLATAIEKAQDNRPEMIAFQRQRLEADRDIQQAKRDFGMRADLFASFGFARGSQQLSDIYNDPISEQQVQLGISVPILDWGRRKTAVGQAQVRRDLLDQQINQDNLDFANAIIQTVNNWEQLQNEVSIQREIQEVSLERFEISRQRYILGDISITDLTIAQREKDQAQRDYINTLRQYWLSYYQIRQLTAYDFIKNQNINYNIN